MEWTFIIMKRYIDFELINLLEHIVTPINKNKV